MMTSLNSPNPTGKGFKAVYPILVKEIFGFVLALGTNPRPKSYSIRVDIFSVNPRIAMQVYIGLELPECFFPLFRKKIPRPPGESFQAFYPILAKEVFRFVLALVTNPCPKSDSIRGNIFG
jgi:hypothetical protein